MNQSLTKLNAVIHRHAAAQLELEDGERSLLHAGRSLVEAALSRPSWRSRGGGRQHRREQAHRHQNQEFLVHCRFLLHAQLDCLRAE
jgi:hypothetical protein